MAEVVTEKELSANTLLTYLNNHDQVDIALVEKIIGTSTEILSVMESLKTFRFDDENLDITDDPSTEVLDILKACTTGNVEKI